MQAWPLAILFTVLYGLAGLKDTTIGSMVHSARAFLSTLAARGGAVKEDAGGIVRNCVCCNVSLPWAYHMWVLRSDRVHVACLGVGWQGPDGHWVPCVPAARHSLLSL